ncbi:hypothetical protein JCM16358_23260 [Halanaerocella petrolearia]
MNFFNYLWGLLNRPLKKGEENKKWLTTLGEELDELKQSIFDVRRAWLVKTAPKNGLELLGEARGLPRYKGEDIELYRERVLAAFDTYQQGGTYPAMKKTLSVLGYPNSEIQLLYKTDPDRWAEFNIFLNQEKINETQNLDIVKKEVRRIKQASSLPNYIATYYQKLIIRTKEITGNSDKRPACGTITSSDNNFCKFHKYEGHAEKSIFNLSFQDIVADHKPQECSKTQKNVNQGLAVRSDFNLTKTTESESNQPVSCGTLRGGEKHIKFNASLRAVNLTLKSEVVNKNNVLQVSSQSTKTTQNGASELNDITIDANIEISSNAIPVCSSTTKYSSGRLVS